MIRRHPFATLACLLTFGLTGCNARNPETFNLRSGASTTRYVKFEAGKRVEIRVKSEKDSDVDLFVYDRNGMLVAKDEEINKNCMVSFKPEATQTYSIRVVNRVLLDSCYQYKNVDNRCTLSWQVKGS